MCTYLLYIVYCRCAHIYYILYQCALQVIQLLGHTLCLYMQGACVCVHAHARECVYVCVSVNVTTLEDRPFRSLLETCHLAQFAHCFILTKICIYLAMKLWDRHTIPNKCIDGAPHTGVLTLCITCPSKHAKVKWLL